MVDNPYQPPSATDLSPVEKRGPSLRGWLVLYPIAWLFVLLSSGVSADTVQFSLPVAWALTIGTLVALAVLRYAVRGWWNVAALPLWLLLPMDVLVLWYWNVAW